jgi:hypothetical protein
VNPSDKIGRHVMLRLLFAIVVNRDLVGEDY